MYFLLPHTSTSQTYTLSLHDALPISVGDQRIRLELLELHFQLDRPTADLEDDARSVAGFRPRCPGELKMRSEEHTSELQSPGHLVCRPVLARRYAGYRRENAVGLLAD